MHILQGTQHLQRNALDFRLGERLRHVVQHGRQVLFAEVHHKEYAMPVRIAKFSWFYWYLSMYTLPVKALAHNYFSQTHNVLVLTSLEYHNLT